MLSTRATEWQDIGFGVSMQLRYVDGDLVGVAYEHPGPDGKQCPAHGWAPLHGPLGWTLVNAEPLTISPSLLCLHCHHHGFIRDGRWVPA